MKLIKLIEKSTGKVISEADKDSILKGADEVDLVRSGLDDTMRNAYQAMSYKWHSEKPIKDLRTSAMSLALEKIAKSYETLGI